MAGYVKGEIDSYIELKVQRKELALIGYAAIGSATIILFFTASVTTLQSHMALVQRQPVVTKFKRAGKLISLIQEDHDKCVVGFDLRPSTILVIVYFNST
jgi:hypothetical protein